MNSEQSKYFNGEVNYIFNLNESNLQGQQNNIPLENFFGIFSNPPTAPQKEEELSEKDLYFNNSGKKTIRNNQVIPKIKFKVNQESNSSKIKSTDFSKKSSNHSNKYGRKKKLTFYKIKNNPIHDKYCADNILRKVQIHYMTFIIKFVNAVLQNLNYKQRFLNIKYEFKSNIKKEYIESLKKKNISEIICNQISNKYRKKIKFISNKKIYEEIKDDKILQKIFDENFLDFFKKIYFKPKEEVSFEEYGLTKDILLSTNVKTFEDLLNDIAQLDKNKEYKKNIKYCIAINYLD